MRRKEGRKEGRIARKQGRTQNFQKQVLRERHEVEEKEKDGEGREVRKGIGSLRKARKEKDSPRCTC